MTKTAKFPDQDALRIEDHWQLMTKGSFYRGGPILASADLITADSLDDAAAKAVAAAGATA